MTVFEGVRVGDFALHSGGKSPVLFDVPSMLKTKRERDYISAVLREYWPNSLHDHIVGIEFGGALLAMLLGQWFMDKRIGFYRPATNEIIGCWPQSQVVLIDDVATTGGSLAQATAALEAAGHKVVHECVLIDRRKA